MVKDFLRAYEQADMVTGHNLIRFDLPVLNADLMRHHHPVLGPKLVQDTIKLAKAKGYKKGQETIAANLEIPSKKQSMDWQAWDDAYQWDDLIAGKRVSWKLVKSRARSDVIQHKQMRQELIDKGYMRVPTMWKP